ncbi:MAG TPA: phosphopyruvate hydratase [Candidatus Levybacteria bacterium]|nr:phosphopyruvate hydratase [Candidatus Levybacteria bacterium]
MKIKDVLALEILDSRGNPTVRTVLTLDDGSTHTSSVPSGASTGINEAVELRDKDMDRYQGQGVLKAIMHVNTVIKDSIADKEVDPMVIDKMLIELDGTENKNKLGANAILSVSMAVARAYAHIENKPLWQCLSDMYFPNTTPGFPRLMVNIINGGVHANWNFDFQEFMIVPNSTTPTESVRIASEIFHSLGKLLKEKGLSTLIGDEGGYSPKLESNDAAFKLILDAAIKAGYENVTDYRLSIDAAASEFYSSSETLVKDGESGKYNLKKEHKVLSSNELSSYYSLLTNTYSLLSIEDPFDQEDYDAHKKFTEMAEKFDFITIGDDLFCTNPKLIEKGIEAKEANGVLIKLNQIGTVTETAAAINLAKRANWKVAVSHRSGETEDSFIADLAYACTADFLKSGSMSRSERLSKYNRLLEIETGIE